MTIGQLDSVVSRETPIFIKSAEGLKQVRLTNYLRGNTCILSWKISALEVIGRKTGLVVEVLLPQAVVNALEE